MVGLSVAVINGNDTLLLKGYGKADVELNVPTPANAMYELGSVTKQFTAAAILQLRDDGKVDLDADISRYLPDFPTQGAKDQRPPVARSHVGHQGITEVPSSATSVAARCRAIRPLRSSRDRRSNSSRAKHRSTTTRPFILLGLIIEKQSGMSYEDYIEKNIFAKLGNEPVALLQQYRSRRRRAHGYTYAGKEVRLADYADLRWPFSAGSLCSTAGDMVAWLQALHGGKVLTPKSYTEMTTASTLADGRPTKYGMGISVANDPRGARMIAHGGAIEGFLSHASWYPDQRVAVVGTDEQHRPDVAGGAVE